MNLERVGLVGENWLSCMRVLEKQKRSRKELGGLSEEGGESAGVEGNRSECWTAEAALDTVEEDFIFFKKIKKKEQEEEEASQTPPLLRGWAPRHSWTPPYHGARLPTAVGPRPTTRPGPRRCQTPPQGRALSLFPFLSFILFFLILFLLLLFLI